MQDQQKTIDTLEEQLAAATAAATSAQEDLLTLEQKMNEADREIRSMDEMVFKAAFKAGAEYTEAELRGQNETDEKKIHQLSRALKTTQVRAKRTEDGATVLAEHAQRLAKHVTFLEGRLAAYESLNFVSPALEL